MFKYAILGSVLLLSVLGVAMAAPSVDAGEPVSALVISEAAAAIGRGSGGDASEGGGTGAGSRAASWLQGEVIPIFFIVIAIALAVVAMQRNAGAAVAILVAAVVVGAFLLVPDQVESFFRAIYDLVL